jgi:hypothetical protein
VDSRYSGVSWAFSGNPEEINEIKRWPVDRRRFYDEVQIPSQFDPVTRNWGFLIPENSDPIRWFKLLLLRPEDMEHDVRNSEQLKNARAKLQGMGASASDAVIEVIAEFLRQIWMHSLEQIRRDIDIDVLPLKVALTVPAIWPAYAREMMKEAASRAGILGYRPIGETTLALVEEPEAAAVATLFDRRKYPEVNVSTFAFLVKLKFD